MAFNSYEFIFIFLPLTYAGFWLLVRWAAYTAAVNWLILTSIIFYAYAGLAGLEIIASEILFNYLIASALVRTEPARKRLRRVLFVGGVTGNVLILSYFKYWNFLLATANTLWATNFNVDQAIFPLGISFLTFQQIAFLADVWSRQIPSFNLRDHLFFSLFFPRTVAGPIVRYKEIVPQLSATAARDFVPNFAVGICLFSIGLFKKTVLADGVAQFVPEAFNPPTAVWLSEPVSLLTAWISVLAYTLELYFDFSGYSDMALGAGRLFGVKLPMNFNSPLRAHNIVEFWGRWHITLTRFLTAYVYTPLVLHITRTRLAKGKSVLHGRLSSLSAIVALVALPTLLTMAVSGVWHGVGWQFVIWGLLHGGYLTINQSWRLLRPRFWPDQVSYDRIMKPLGAFLTFMAVTVAMVFFRATSPASALSILGGMVGVNGVVPHLYENLGFGLSTYLVNLIMPFSWVGILLLIVMLMPNSLELMRRFQPASDFPRETKGMAHPQVIQSSVSVASIHVASVTAYPKLRAALTACTNVRTRGIALNGPTAAVIALTIVLALFALSASSGFLYFRF